MPGPKKDNNANMGGRQNGNRAGFQTDAAISNNRSGKERVLQRWVPDTDVPHHDSLEKPSGSGGKPWNQFAENEKLFGLTTDYDENIYTTAIDKNHPQYRERMAAAEKKAREIERSIASSSHVAEERVVDYIPGTGNSNENEEDKYSGVRRNDFPPLGGRENKYMPPAKRAPAAHSTVKGAPIDPAIISSQIKVPGSKKSTPTPDSGKNGVIPKIEGPKPTNAKATGGEEKTADTQTAAPNTEAKATDKINTPARASGSNSRTMSPQVREHNATSTVEGDVLREFKSFANQQREVAQKARSNKAKADKEVKLTELKKFANNFKLSTPVPTDLVSIIAKDPAKQKEIQAKAIKNAEEVAKSKAEATLKDKPAAKDTPAKAGEQTGVKNAPDSRAPRAPNAPQVTASITAQNRHSVHRQQYPPQPYQQYRNNRNGPQQHVPQQTNNLAQRIRNSEQQKFTHNVNNLQHAPGHDGRTPPTGPANNVDPNFTRRPSGVPPHMGAKLNPNSHEFRPSVFAAPFNPTAQPSTTPSPRAAVNSVSAPGAPANGEGRLIRRKTKAVDPAKCNILSHIKTIPVPEQLRNKWSDNQGLRPSYDTDPTWRKMKDVEKPDSTMHLTYKEHMDRNPFAGTMPTPSPPHAVPLAHQHQLPFSLQQGGHNIGPRQSPHMAQMHMHNPQHGPGPQPTYGHDDHRMVHSNSSQSFASPRLGQVAIAYPGMNSPAQMQYNQPVFMGPGAPQMNQYRSFSNNPGYMPPQQGQMGHMMMQPQFMPGPHGMPQMMYPGAHPQFIPPGGPPQGANGYPSPGRAQAPMMAQQGSQQGQPMYGMSPNVQYTQPAYGHGQPGGPVSNPRGYNNAGQQHSNSGPQQAHQYGGHPQQRTSSNSGYNKNYAAQNQHQQGQANQPPVPAPLTRGTEGSEEAK